MLFQRTSTFENRRAECTWNLEMRSGYLVTLLFVCPQRRFVCEFASTETLEGLDFRMLVQVARQMFLGLKSHAAKLTDKLVLLTNSPPVCGETLETRNLNCFEQQSQMSGAI